MNRVPQFLLLIASLTACSEVSLAPSGAEDLYGTPYAVFWSYPDVDHTLLAAKSELCGVIKANDTIYTYGCDSTHQTDQLSAVVTGASTVKFNSVSLERLGGGNSSSFSLFERHWEIGGGTYTFEVVGNPSYTVSVDAPRTDLSIRSPENGDTASIRGPLEVRWDSDTDGCSVVVELSSTDSDHGFLSVLKADTGMHTFSSSDMSSLPPGVYSLSVYKGKSVFGTSGGKDFAASLYILKSVGLILE
jgi:hypothetical protein